MTVIYGTPNADDLSGGPENDTLFGRQGDDYLSGYGGGKDKLYGEEGKDYLQGNGDDSLFGGVGNDVVDNIEASGNFYVKGGSGNDTVWSSTGKDIINGESGDDVLYGADGNDKLYGKGGNDYINSGAGKDSLYGGAGDDALFGYAGNQFMCGGDGNDSLASGTGNDSLCGRDGDDSITGSSVLEVGEKDRLSGGAGKDKFILGNLSRVFYDDGNATTEGSKDYALITDFQTNQDVIQLSGSKNDYILTTAPNGSPQGTAIYFDKPSGEKDELIAIVQGDTDLVLEGDEFSFQSADFNLSDLNGSNGFILNSGIDVYEFSATSLSTAGDVNGDGFDDFIVGNPGASGGEGYLVFGKPGGFGSVLNLAEFNGSNGFIVHGIGKGVNIGNSVSAAGDINGDGFDDFLIGGHDANFYGYPPKKESYIVFGKKEGFSASFNLSELNGNNGSVLSGSDATDFTGFVVNSAGDVNGDGFDDILLGAPFTSANNQQFSGESYLVFGSSAGFGSSFNLDKLNGSNGLVLKGGNNYDYSGSSLSTVGDINGDGLDDFLIGASLADPNGLDGAGKSYVVFGQENFSASLNLSELNGSNSFVINGINKDDRSGIAVSSAGDVNGDGFGDLLIGASGADSNGQERAGESYVLFGTSAGFGASLNLSKLNGNNGFVIKGINANDYSGTSVSSAGDVNGDGIDDLLIGASGADPNGQEHAGESYVVFGISAGFGASLDLSKLDGSNGFVINGIDSYDGSGRSLSSAGDVNGDGFDDILIGAPAAHPGGKSYTIFGRDFSNAVTHSGTSGNDLLTGTANDDILIGGLGNDTLAGGNGEDVLKGSSGDDVVSFNAAARIAGGSGTDTLRIDDSGANLDLATIVDNKLTDLEIIDLTGTGNNSLKFNQLDVLHLSDSTNQLLVKGNTGDIVTSTGFGWSFIDPTNVDNILYNRYTLGAATLLVDADISSTIS